MRRIDRPRFVDDYNEAGGAKEPPGCLVDEAGDPVIPELVKSRLLNGSYPAQVYCFTCKSVFIVVERQVLANGHVITQCPWCRPDSEAWKHGRGA